MIKNTIKFLFLLLLGTTSVYANEELTLNTDASFNPTYQNRYSFLLGVNPSVTKANDVTNFTFSYGKKMEDYWLDTNFQIANGLFEKMTTNNSSATGLSTTQLLGTKNKLITFGIGVGRESNYSQTLLPFSHIYESMAADVTYNYYKESASEKTFTGPGLLAKFSLFKKFSDYVSFGTQFTYNLAVVKRAQDTDTEISSARSLTMSYLTVGFDLSFFL